MSQINDFKLGKNSNKYNSNKYQSYDIEFNVFFDKPFKRDNKKDEKDRKIYQTNLPINDYVKQLHRVMLEGSKSVRFSESIFEQKDDHEPKLRLPTVKETPYGLQLEYELPLPAPNDLLEKCKLKSNKFRVHLKDSLKIQDKKRFSQDRRGSGPPARVRLGSRS